MRLNFHEHQLEHRTHVNPPPTLHGHKHAFMEFRIQLNTPRKFIGPAKLYSLECNYDETILLRRQQKTVCHMDELIMLI